MLQINNSEDCIVCDDKCCRFAKHLLRFSPLFTKEEYKSIIKKGYNKRLFRIISKNIYQLKLNKKEKGFYICPFLTDGVWCSIYRIAPYYCKIWPFVLMRNKEKNKIFLMVDKVNECYAIKKASKEKIKKYIKYLKNYLESKRMTAFFKKYPELISNFDCDLTRICFMENLTKKLNDAN